MMLPVSLRGRIYRLYGGDGPDPRHSDFPRPPFEEMPFFVPLFRGPFLGLHADSFAYVQFQHCC